MKKIIFALALSFSFLFAGLNDPSLITKEDKPTSQKIKDKVYSFLEINKKSAQIDNVIDIFKDNADTYSVTYSTDISTKKSLKQKFVILDFGGDRRQFRYLIMYDQPTKQLIVLYSENIVGNVQEVVTELNKNKKEKNIKEVVQNDRHALLTNPNGFLTYFYNLNSSETMGLKTVYNIYYENLN